MGRADRGKRPSVGKMHSRSARPPKADRSTSVPQQSRRPDRTAAPPPDVDAPSPLQPQGGVGLLTRPAAPPQPSARLARRVPPWRGALASGLGISAEHARALVLCAAAAAAALAVGALSSRSMLLALLVTVVPLGVVIAVQSSRLVVLAALAAVPFASDVLGGAVPGVQVAATDLLLVVCVVGLVLPLLRDQELAARLARLRPLAGPLLVYVAALLVVLAAHPEVTSLANSLQRVELAVVPAVVAAALLDRSTLMTGLRLYVLSSAALAAAFTVAQVGGAPEVLFGVNKNPAGQFIASALLIVIGTRAVRGAAQGAAGPCADRRSGDDAEPRCPARLRAVGAGAGRLPGGGQPVPHRAARRRRVGVRLRRLRCAAREPAGAALRHQQRERLRPQHPRGLPRGRVGAHPCQPRVRCGRRAVPSGSGGGPHAHHRPAQRAALRVRRRRRRARCRLRRAGRRPRRARAAPAATRVAGRRGRRRARRHPGARARRHLLGPRHAGPGLGARRLRHQSGPRTRASRRHEPVAQRPGRRVRGSGRARCGAGAAGRASRDGRRRQLLRGGGPRGGGCGRGASTWTPAPTSASRRRSTSGSGTSRRRATCSCSTPTP